MTNLPNNNILSLSDLIIDEYFRFERDNNRRPEFLIMNTEYREILKSECRRIFSFDIENDTYQLKPLNEYLGMKIIKPLITYGGNFKLAFGVSGD